MRNQDKGNVQEEIGTKGVKAASYLWIYIEINRLSKKKTHQYMKNA